MKPSRLLFTVAVAGLFLQTTPLLAQGYRVRLDSRIQSVAYRGVELDSIPAASVVTGANGGLESPDGFAVSCPAGGAFCSFYRPGAERSGGPLVSTVDLALWDLGVSGLSIRGRGRVGLDVGNADVWPGNDPELQLLEGYLEYARPAFTLQGGRLTVASRFGWTGFDGGKGTARIMRGRLSASLYAGWGLARGVALPVSSPALDPFDPFRPTERQMVYGGDLGWSVSGLRGQLRYERQTNPGTDGLASERLGVDLAVRLASGVSLTGGADYDLAAGWMGSAEGALAITPIGKSVSATVGVRRYRPHFELWTIWGAFSPVPYHAGFGALSYSPIRKLQLRARGEVFGFDNAETVTPLVDAKESGWRVGAGATYAHSRSLVVALDYHLDKGVGARSLGVDGAVTWQPIPDLAVTGRVANLKRALEFRFNDADVWLYGFSADYRASRNIYVFGGASIYDETRDRPDAAGFSWNQVRLNGGLRLALGSADRAGLPPSILRIPEGGDR